MRGIRIALPLFVAVLVLGVAGSALAQEYITELRIVAGNDPRPAPAGYTKINKDLNKGAGGDFIYLCYKKGDGAPLTKIFVTIGEDRRHPNVPEKCSIINVDLNRDAGGNYIYLWTTHDPKCAPITDIIVLEGEGARPPAGYTKINVDLNRHAGGAYLYFAYRTETIAN
jgi:hypothetical protein